MENLLNQKKDPICYPLFIYKKHFCILKEIQTIEEVVIIFVQGHDEEINLNEFIKDSINTKELVCIKDGKIKFTGKRNNFSW